MNFGISDQPHSPTPNSAVTHTYARGTQLRVDGLGHHPSVRDARGGGPATATAAGAPRALHPRQRGRGRSAGTPSVYYICKASYPSLSRYTETRG